MFNTEIIGNKIAEARKTINISQARLAERLSISSQAVGKWERGESMPDIMTLNRLAEILGVDLNYFSESFHSATSELAPVEPLVNQSDELPSGVQKKKLSWDMSRGNWVDADFSGLKNLHEKFSFENCAFTRVTFRNATLINTFFKNKSLKRIRFIECKADKLTYAFLKNGKADLTGISLLTQ